MYLLYFSVVGVFWCRLVYFGVFCVVGVVWISCCIFCSYTRFILIDNNQNYVNPNLREHQKYCGVCHRRFVCLIYVFFYVEGVVVVVCLMK